MNSYVGMTIVEKKNRDKMIISVNKAYFSHFTGLHVFCYLFIIMCTATGCYVNCYNMLLRNSNCY